MNKEGGRIDDLKISDLKISGAVGHFVSLGASHLGLFLFFLLPFSLLFYWVLSRGQGAGIRTEVGGWYGLTQGEQRGSREGTMVGTGIWGDLGIKGEG